MSETAQATEIHDADAFSALGEAFESAVEKIGDVAASTRDHAKTAARNVSKAVSTGVYKGSYGTSYGVVFGAVFLTELLPLGSSLRRGFEDGAHSALEKHAGRRHSREADAGALEFRAGSEVETRGVAEKVAVP